VNNHLLESTWISIVFAAATECDGVLAFGT